jgi:hypothetical protein
MGEAHCAGPDDKIGSLEPGKTNEATTRAIRGPERVRVPEYRYNS